MCRRESIKPPWCNQPKKTYRTKLKTTQSNGDDMIHLSMVMTNLFLVLLISFTDTFCPYRNTNGTITGSKNLGS